LSFAGIPRLPKLFLREYGRAGLFPVISAKAIHAAAGGTAAAVGVVGREQPMLATADNDLLAYAAGLDMPEDSLAARMDAHTNFSAQTEALAGDAPWKSYVAGLLTSQLARNPRMSPAEKTAMVASMASKLAAMDPK